MKPLHEDQVHGVAWMQQCTHIWSDDVGRSNKSGVWDYFRTASETHNIPLVNHTNLPDSGVIFVGMCHLLEDVFSRMPDKGNYIIVHRTNDRPFTELMYRRKPRSVKHIYTVDCQVNYPDVTAIPFGLASINGEDNLIKQIASTEYFIQPPKTKLFVCFNTNKDTPHRIEAIRVLKDKAFAFVYELEYPHKQMAGDEFYRNVKAHPFTMALAGCSADASRQWAAITLGSIPIVTDCIEMRHFEDMPMIFCPKDMNDITEVWLDSQAKAIETKGTISMRMSYWIGHLNVTKRQYGIS